MNHIDDNFNGVFYKIKDQEQNTCGYLLGIIHFSTCFDNRQPKGFSEAVLKRIEKASSLIIESNILQNLKCIESCGGPTIEQRRKNYFSMDLELLMDATQKEKEIKQLETPEFQKLALEEAEKDVKRVERKALEDKTFRQFCADRWKIRERSGHLFELSDENEIESILKFGYSPSGAKEFFDDRNEAMVKKIDMWLKAGGKHFIAVGLAHAIGKQGIVALLSEKGWHLERIKRDTVLF